MRPLPRGGRRRGGRYLGLPAPRPQAAAGHHDAAELALLARLGRGAHRRAFRPQMGVPQRPVSGVPSLVAVNQSFSVYGS